jgi:aminocarboxymuconate-semialdehyde decarboxylase
MIVDVHAHHAPAAFIQAAKSQHAGSPIAKASVPFDERFSQMAEAGVERQVLSIARGYYTEDEALGSRTAVLVNDQFAELCSNWPQRLSFWASLPLPHLDAAVHELERALRLPGCLGVLLNCSILDRSVADERFEPIYAELDRHGAVVFLHPSQNGLMSPLINDWGLTVCAGASVEDSVAALHLISRQIPGRYPRVRFIVPHFGGLLPMQLQRLDGQMPQEGFAERPSVTARRFFYDTVGWGSRAALLAAIEAFGETQLVPGSDYPILLPWESYAQTFRHIEQAGLASDTVQRILHVNAPNLLGLR